MSFFHVLPLADAVSKSIKEAAIFTPKEERIPLLNALGQVLGEDIFSEKEVPEFHRATLDGYAVKSEDVGGASEFSPTFLKVVGKVEMGKKADVAVESGEAVYVPTGGMMPQGADAIVMIEYVEKFDDTTIVIYQTVSPNTGVMLTGEDMKKGEFLIPKGTRLTPRHLGVLAAQGRGEIRCHIPPTIAYYSTGDEIIDPPQKLLPGEIWDITKYTTAAFLESYHMPVKTTGHIPDNRQQLEERIKQAVNQHDVVILAGGSSVGTKDMVGETLEKLGEPGVFIHGLLLRPGKPALVARVGNTMVFGLPGHPASSFLVLQELVLPVLQSMMGEGTVKKPQPQGILTKNVPASGGRRTIYTVQLEEKPEGWRVTPLFGKSGAITWLAKGDGYIQVPEGTEGYLAGEPIDIYFFQ